MLAVQLWLEISHASIVYVGAGGCQKVCMGLCEAFNSALFLQAFWIQNKIISEKKSYCDNMFSKLILLLSSS